MLLAVFGVSTNIHAKIQESVNSSETGWMSISDSAQKIIVQDYVNALDSFALAMPIIGGDTESTWAADTVHVMAKRVKEGQPELSSDSARFTMGPFIRIHYVDYWRKHNYAPQPKIFYILNNNYIKILMWCKRLLKIHHV